jgi:hypothetical protein
MDFKIPQTLLGLKLVAIGRTRVLAGKHLARGPAREDAGAPTTGAVQIARLFFRTEHSIACIIYRKVTIKHLLFLLNIIDTSSLSIVKTLVLLTLMHV